MKAYVLKRLFSLFPVLFIVSLVVFVIVYLTPGDPAAVMLGDEATPESLQELRELMGLNKPWYAQYFHWLANVLRGDLGQSFFMNQPVTEAIADRLQPTLTLTVMALVLAIGLAIPLGIVAAMRRDSAVDQALMGATLIGNSIPSFLVGLFLMLLVAVQLQWLPVAGYEPWSAGAWNHLKYLILPAITLGLVQTALIARMTRSAMLDVLNEGYIRTAKAKGVRERRIAYKHALRNAFIPILTVIGHTFGSLVAGAAVTEAVFNIPGIGQLMVNALERRDYAVIQGVVLFVTLAHVLINLFVDLLYAFIDPRVRFNRE